MEEMDKLWRQAIYKWRQVFEILGYPGALGVALLQEQLGSSPDECSTVLRDSLGIKSPRTAYKRVQTLLQYFFMATTAHDGLESMGQTSMFAIFGSRFTCQIFGIKGHDTLGSIQV